MKCCPECIGDGHIRREIIPKYSTETGTCSYCGSTNIQLVEPSELIDQFELLAGIYTLNVDGKTLVEWFKDDWNMFEHPNMDVAHAKELLADILNDGEIVREHYVPSELSNSNTLDIWETFRDELKHQNRFFPKVDLDSARLGELLSYLLHPDELEQEWYRARIQKDNMAYTSDKMGAPPKKLALHGRANPAGIPYLYLASEMNTAISEIRPHTGEIANVATFTVTSNLKLVDLRHPRKTISPFLLAEARDILLLRSDIEFLERLGDELTRPVLPQAAAIDYIPSQYLCEFIKSRGYHGVMYRSSVGDGINIALFNPKSAVVGTVSEHRVTRVSVEVSSSDPNL